MISKIHQIQSMGLVDGPGVRCVVFMQGCALRCKFCHNPDSWNLTDFKHQVSAQELLKKVLRFRDYFARGGGVTLSGGEPLLQLDFCLEFFALAKENGINTCIDTSLNIGEISAEKGKKLLKLFNLTDTVLLDIKHVTPRDYKIITGGDIAHFESGLEILNKSNAKVWIRQVVTPTLTDSKEYILALKEYIKKINRIEKIELLPYHTLGLEKYKKLNIDYPLADITPPTNAEIENLEKIIKEN